MMTFYLNDCLTEPVEDLQEEVLVSIFCDFIESYAHYVKDGARDNYQLILKCDPSQLKIGGKAIKELISLIPRVFERESLRKKAYSMFNNYPANHFIEGRKKWNEYEWQDYMFLNQDANNLFVAYKEDWCIASIPIREEVTISPLSIVGKNDKMSVEILNWYIKNTCEIKQIEYANLPEEERALKILPYYFKGKQVIYSDEFVSQFKDPHCNVRNVVVARLLEAYKAGLLFPSGYDDNIVKKCQGKGNELTYELRQKGTGMRAYFYSDEQRLVLASLHTKAESSGAEQGCDINHASKIIFDMLF